MMNEEFENFEKKKSLKIGNTFFEGHWQEIQERFERFWKQFVGVAF